MVSNGGLERCAEPRPRCEEWGQALVEGVLLGDCKTDEGYWTALCRDETCICGLEGVTQCACPWAKEDREERTCCYVQD
jgi:hypothetical protein